MPRCLGYGGWPRGYCAPRVVVGSPYYYSPYYSAPYDSTYYYSPYRTVVVQQPVVVQQQPVIVESQPQIVQQPIIVQQQPTTVVSGVAPVQQYAPAPVQSVQAEQGRYQDRELGDAYMRLGDFPNVAQSDST